MLPRGISPRLNHLLGHSPAVVLLGSRKVGKTTLALEIGEKRPSVYLDLEHEADRAKLSDPVRYFADHESELVILDEVHRLPELFQRLRGVIDRGRRQGNPRKGVANPVQCEDNLPCPWLFSTLPCGKAASTARIPLEGNGKDSEGRNMTPEERARQEIDAMLTASGWVVREKRNANLAAARGVAVAELSFKTGEPDYTLFVDGTSLSIEPDDLELAPFNQRGGLGKAHQLFGEDLPDLLNELNEALAA